MIKSDKKTKYIPLKYVFGMAGIFFVIPVLILLVLLETIGIQEDFKILYAFLGMLIFVGPIVFFLNSKNASVVIEGGAITNCINDGTLNFGWTEELIRITKVELVDNAEIKKYYYNCKSKKAILIHFGPYQVRYIAVDLFTNKQIKKIIKLIGELV